MGLFPQLVFGILATVVTVSVGIAVEAACRRSRQLARTVFFNAGFAVVMGVWGRLLQPLGAAESVLVQRHLGLTPIPLPDEGWLLLCSAAVVMLAADLIFYWVHRAQHKYEFLWSMHSFHHSDDDLNVTSSSRHYWLEKPFWMMVFYLPLGLVFRISPAVATVYGLMFTFFAMFPHMNIRLELGPLTRVILGPQVHRIHHSVEREHFNTNFAGAFPIWDLVFGTYRAPGAGEFPQTGVPGMVSLPGAGQTVLWPFYKTDRAEPKPAASSQGDPGQQPDKASDSVSALQLEMRSSR